MSLYASMECIQVLKYLSSQFHSWTIVTLLQYNLLNQLRNFSLHSNFTDITNSKTNLQCMFVPIIMHHWGVYLCMNVRLIKLTSKLVNRIGIMTINTIHMMTETGGKGISSRSSLFPLGSCQIWNQTQTLQLSLSTPWVVRERWGLEKGER